MSRQHDSTFLYTVQLLLSSMCKQASRRKQQSKKNTPFYFLKTEYSSSALFVHKETEHPRIGVSCMRLGLQEYAED